MTTKSKKTAPVRQAFDFRTIKTAEDAFKKTGYDSSKLPDLSMIPEKFRAQLTTCFLLMVIFEAINDGWEPDFSNHNQGKYYPWPWVLSSGFGFSSAGYGYACAHAIVGSRLCFESEDKARHAGNQFLDLYKQFLT